MRVEFREVAAPGDMESARMVRTRVFIEEQGVPPDIEMDGHDDTAIHVVCLLEGEAVGTGRLVSTEDGMKLGRVAVLGEHRGKGLGTGIVMWLLDRARRLGHDRVYANVQLGAGGFYEKLGFRPAGDVFVEAGIEHVRMHVFL